MVPQAPKSYKHHSLPQKKKLLHWMEECFWFFFFFGFFFVGISVPQPGIEPGPQQ